MMEVFKNLLEPDCEESEFNELIQMIKTAKEAIENLNKRIDSGAKVIKKLIFVFMRF